MWIVTLQSIKRCAKLKKYAKQKLLTIVNDKAVRAVQIGS